MKKQLVILFLLALSIRANAQLSTFKVGANYNADIASHKLGKINYPSWEISYERALGKKFSINCTFNYANRDYRPNNDYSLGPQTTILYAHTRWTNYDQTFIFEARYYLKTNRSGLFLQLGVPFTYSTEKSYYITPAGEGTYKVYSYAISTIGGFGIKYPLSSRFGVEMNMSISPSLNFLDVDYGTSGFIKSGVKLFFSLDKSKTAKLK